MISTNEKPRELMTMISDKKLRKDYLQDEALTYYFESLCNIEDWSKLKESLIIRFQKVKLTPLVEMMRITQEEQETVTQYFHRKMQLINNVELNLTSIVELLNEGVKTKYKPYLATIDTVQPSEWLTMAIKVENSLTGSGTPVEKGRLQTLNPALHPSPRPAGCYGNSQVQRPPMPCRICERLGLELQWHYHSVCPYQRPTASRSPATPRVQRPTASRSFSSASPHSYQAAASSSFPPPTPHDYQPTVPSASSPDSPSGIDILSLSLERLSSRFAQAPSSEEAIADFLAEVTPLEFDEWDQLFLADISRDQIAAAIHRLPNGRASGWDGLPCEFVKAFEDFFAEVLWQVFEASRLRGALPPSSRRSKVILLPKVHGGPGLQASRPISLPTTDYRVLSGVLMARLRRHLPDLVPQCQTYAVPGRSSSWNIARVSDEAAGASRHDTPLAVISLDLKSAFDTLSRSYLFALLEKLGLPSTFLGWIAVLFGEADASIRVGDVYTKAFPLLNGVRQGCRLSAALFSIGVGPLLRRLERTLGRGNVVAYADDIVLFIRDDAQFELVPLIFEEFRMSSGVAINFKKSCGLWNTVASQASHLMGLLERAIARWSPFTRGLSLVGRARAANSLVLGSILHHLHGYLPPETTVGQLQARLARFLWGTSRVSWLPGRILARPVSDGGVGLLDIAGQLRLACLKGVQASLRGAANGYSWLVRSRAWLTPPAPDVWHSPRRRRLLSLWEAASSVLELDHRVLHPACLRSLRLRGDNRFLRPPDLLAPERWLQATVGDFSDGAPALARSTRAALLDAQHLGAFCQRLLRENASSSYHAEYEVETIVLRGSATPITRLPSQRARRALDSARLQAHPTAELAARWTPTVDVPRSIPWADLRRNCFSGHDADVALRLALHALPHPDHPASRRANCAACGSSDGSLAHGYWSCRAVRTLLREVFASCDLPLDLQAWLFGVCLHPEAVKLTSVAKATIYKTISRRLVANGLHSCRPLRRLPLTPPNRRQRLEWCRARSTWMTEWHRVVFSDESRFCVSSDSRRVRVWSRRGERSNPAAIGTMTAQRYADDVLRPVTLPYLQGVPNALYQQDNARPHTARISQQALQDVQMLPWSPCSPDLSPIEHV
ncbi:hypothetical protein LAZ67_5002162 [Cordylochernes scorpioides]|uniref:Reverse transcriptase domain-containing protein n=1 Tax=Cordylochernes scorpioides TaxID=51811 RepID=A0ABY6KJ90_9ARAC|nr:hypothetical protein LAZ67_5002162 [Cordylochernes scorpioides]